MPLSLSLLGSLLLPTHAQTTSPKRGLIHIPSPQHPSDDNIWSSTPSPPTWYYNYNATPSASYPSSSMHFIPMLWGASTTFLSTITSQLSVGANITHILSFNEPDAPLSVGGSNLSPARAADVWKSQLAPLQRRGIKVGAPAVTGGEAGWVWLDAWERECSGCEPDFVTVHWYGDFEGLMSHLGRVTQRWIARDVWVTEWGFADQSLDVTQDFFKRCLASFDSWRNISRYSYFGAFRSDVSNVGHNAAMLTEHGELTDVGSWYFGGDATGKVPGRGSGGSVASGAVGSWHGEKGCRYGLLGYPLLSVVVMLVLFTAV